MDRLWVIIIILLIVAAAAIGVYIFLRNQDGYALGENTPKKKKYDLKSLKALYAQKLQASKMKAAKWSRNPDIELIDRNYEQKLADIVKAPVFVKPLSTTKSSSYASPAMIACANGLLPRLLYIKEKDQFYSIRSRIVDVVLSAGIIGLAGALAYVGLAQLIPTYFNTVFSSDLTIFQKYSKTETLNTKNIVKILRTELDTNDIITKMRECNETIEEISYYINTIYLDLKKEYGILCNRDSIWCIENSRPDYNIVGNLSVKGEKNKRILLNESLDHIENILYTKNSSLSWLIYSIKNTFELQSGSTITADLFKNIYYASQILNTINIILSMEIKYCQERALIDLTVRSGPNGDEYINPWYSLKIGDPEIMKSRIAGKNIPQLGLLGRVEERCNVMNIFIKSTFKNIVDNIYYKMFCYTPASTEKLDNLFKSGYYRNVDLVAKKNKSDFIKYLQTVTESDVMFNTEENASVDTPIKKLINCGANGKHYYLEDHNTKSFENVTTINAEYYIPECVKKEGCFLYKALEANTEPHLPFLEHNKDRFNNFVPKENGVAYFDKDGKEKIGDVNISPNPKFLLFDKYIKALFPNCIFNLESLCKLAGIESLSNSININKYFFVKTEKDIDYYLPGYYLNAIGFDTYNIAGKEIPLGNNDTVVYSKDGGYPFGLNRLSYKDAIDTIDSYKIEDEITSELLTKIYNLNTYCDTGIIINMAEATKNLTINIVPSEDIRKTLVNDINNIDHINTDISNVNSCLAPLKYFSEDINAKNRIIYGTTLNEDASISVYDFVGEKQYPENIFDITKYFDILVEKIQENFILDLSVEIESLLEKDKTIDKVYEANTGITGWLATGSLSEYLPSLIAGTRHFNIYGDFTHEITYSTIKNMVTNAEITLGDYNKTIGDAKAQTKINGVEKPCTAVYDIEEENLFLQINSLSKDYVNILQQTSNNYKVNLAFNFDVTNEQVLELEHYVSAYGNKEFTYKLFFKRIITENILTRFIQIVQGKPGVEGSLIESKRINPTTKYYSDHQVVFDRTGVNRLQIFPNRLEYRDNMFPRLYYYTSLRV